MVSEPTPDELRARLDKSWRVREGYPLTNEDAAAILALLARLAAAEDVPQRLHDLAVAEGRRLRDAYIEELRQERDDLAARLAAAEQVLGYCASPTLGWDSSKGPILDYVRTADENLVRSALQAAIFGAQRVLGRDASGH